MRVGAVVTRGPVLVIRPMLGIVGRFLVAVLAVGVCLVLGGRHHGFVVYLAVTELSDDHLHGGGAVADEQQGRDDGTEAHGFKDTTPRGLRERGTEMPTAQGTHGGEPKDLTRIAARRTGPCIALHGVPTCEEEPLLGSGDIAEAW